jgi:hypothetical protein
MTTRTTKPVTIRTRTVGQSFGCEGQIVASNGRVLATTRVFPHGFDSNAYQAAESLAAERGYVVRSDDE